MHVMCISTFYRLSSSHILIQKHKPRNHQDSHFAPQFTLFFVFRYLLSDYLRIRLQKLQKYPLYYLEPFGDLSFGWVFDIFCGW